MSKIGLDKLWWTKLLRHAQSAAGGQFAQTNSTHCMRFDFNDLKDLEH